MSVAVVVPCFNEERRLDAEAYLRFLKAEPGVTLWFVNDGSSDGTLGMLHRLSESGDRIHVVNLSRNAGKAEAVRHGLLAAAASAPHFFGFWDADLATPLTEIPAMLEVFDLRPVVDLVFASRVRLLGRDIDRRAGRHYIGRVGATLISLTLGIAVYDTQCGAKLFRCQPDIVKLFERPFISRWIFDVEIIARVIESRGRDAASAAIYELPLRSWHDVDGSKVRSHDFLRALADLWKINGAYRLRE